MPSLLPEYFPLNGESLCDKKQILVQADLNGPDPLAPMLLSVEYSLVSRNFSNSSLMNELPLPVTIVSSRPCCMRILLTCWMV